MHLVYLILCITLYGAEIHTFEALTHHSQHTQQSQLMGWVGWSALFSLWLNHCNIFIHTLDICEKINL